MNTKTNTRDDSAGYNVKTYTVVTVAVIALMAIVGLVMRLTQGNLVNIRADLFYRLMTVHGIALIGVAELGGAAVCWHFLNTHVRLSKAVLHFNLAFFLVGVFLILGSIFYGGFAAGYTALFPLPAFSQGLWSKSASAGYIVGMLFIGTGFLVFYLDILRANISRYGNIPAALGWPQLFGRTNTPPPPAVVVASTVVSCLMVLCVLTGATIFTIILVSLFNPAVVVNPLVAKNMTFFFGHVFMNCTIYQAVVAIYEILPRYTRRPWAVNKWFLGAWTATGFMVVVIYPQHLYQDFVMPLWVLVLAEVFTWGHGIPVLLETSAATLFNVYRSNIRWDIVSGLLFLSVLAWSIAVIPAVADGLIVVNQLMHNTLWVPGHFHMNFLLSVVPMLFAFAFYVVRNGQVASATMLDRVWFWLFAIGGFGFTFTLLASGKNSIPRRFAAHLPDWLIYNYIGTFFATLAAVSITVFFLKILGHLIQKEDVDMGVAGLPSQH